MVRNTDASGLGEFELLVMLAVILNGEGGYSRTIRSAIEKRTGRSVSRGALYVTLDRLSDKGLLETWKGAPLEQRGGKARRHYRATERGLEAVRESRRMLQSMWSELDDALAGT